MKPTGFKDQVKKNTKVLLLTAIIVSALSAYTVYFYNSKPLYISQETTHCTYQHIGAYGYEARLSPNLFYNKTVLATDEGVLYTTIVETLNVTFEHEFRSTPSPDEYQEEVEYLLSLEAQGKWTKVLNKNETERLFLVEEDPQFFISIDCKKLIEVFSKIIVETGTGQGSYSLLITPVIHTRAIVNGKLIDEDFTPELRMTFESDESVGKYIKLDGLRRVEPKQITETELILNPEVRSLRTYSYLFSSTALSSLFLASILHMKYREKPVKVVRIEDLVKRYGDMIVRSHEDAKNVGNVINVESMDEMEKLSDLLMKPIMLSNSGDGHVFYIIDDNQKYQYRFSEGKKG